MIDLTETEQANARKALRFLKARIGSWAALQAPLGYKKKTLTNVRDGQGVSATLAFRVARLAGVTLEDVLVGKFPPSGVCPHCGK